METNMNRMWVVAIVVFPFCCPLARAADEPKPADAIRKVLDDQVVAWNKGDLKTFMAGYWESPKLSFYSGSNKTQGWKETLERYRKRYQADGKEMGKLSFSELDVEMLGPDAALVRGRWHVEMTKEKHAGLFTLIVRKLPDGWKIVHDHTSGE
jgi:beta-aspartyl-peptidase (threonine type)